MPLFRFKAADSNGSVLETVVEGESQNDAVRRLRMRQLTPIHCLGEGEIESSSKSVFSFGAFSVVEFTERLVPLLEAGIPLEKSLAIIEETMERDKDARFIRDMRQGLHEGRKFSQLVRDRGNMFPRLYANIVEVGEEAGALPQVLKQLQEYLNERKEMRSYVLSASIYPCAIAFVSFGVVMFLLGYIVPKFGKILTKGKKEPAGITQFLLDLSWIVNNYWYLIVLLLAVIVAIPLYISREEKYRQYWDSFVLKIPFINKIIVTSNVSSLIKTLSVMLKSGVHLLEAVQISARVIANSTIRDSISSVSSRLRQGERLSDALDQSEYLPKLVIKMLAVGEETGNVEDMMERVGTRYDTDLRNKIKNLLNLFEPAVIVFLGAVIAFIVVTMFMAISDITKM